MTDKMRRYNDVMVDLPQLQQLERPSADSQAPATVATGVPNGMLAAGTAWYGHRYLRARRIPR